MINNLTVIRGNSAKRSEPMATHIAATSGEPKSPTIEVVLSTPAGPRWIEDA
jgi:hypothetical protein